MIFGVKHAQDDGRSTSFHQLQTIPRVYISLTRRGSSQMRLSSETKSMDFFVEGRGRSSAFLRPLPSFSTVEGMSGRLLAAVRPFSSICLCRTFLTTLLQAL